jgi:hypothetical protein
MLIRKFPYVGAPSGAAQPRLESVRGLAVIVLILGIALIDANLVQLPPRCLSLRLDREHGAENTSYFQFGADLSAFQARTADPVFGTWKLNPARSTFAGDTQPKSLTLRIEPHANGEVFTLDRTETNGRSTSSSVLLYLDGRARAFDEAGCSGTQSSRRLDSRTVEILHGCAGGQSTRIIRRSGQPPNELVLDITDQYADGRHYERRLVLERQ